jgi:hypothetical protein
MEVLITTTIKVETLHKVEDFDDVESVLRFLSGISDKEHEQNPYHTEFIVEQIKEGEFEILDSKFDILS